MEIDSLNNSLILENRDKKIDSIIRADLSDRSL